MTDKTISPSATANTKPAPSVPVTAVTDLAVIAMEGFRHLEGLMQAICDRCEDSEHETTAKLSRLGANVAADFHNMMDCDREQYELQSAANADEGGHAASACSETRLAVPRSERDSAADGEGRVSNAGLDSPPVDVADQLTSTLFRLATSADAGEFDGLPDELTAAVSQAALLQATLKSKADEQPRVAHWMGNFQLSVDGLDGIEHAAHQRLAAARGQLMFVSDALQANPPESMAAIEVEMAFGGIDLLLSEALSLIEQMNAGGEE